MTGKYIATKLHQAMELAPDDSYFSEAAALPHYVIDGSLRSLMLRSDVQASILAMIEADIAHLPFPRMLVEMDFGIERVRCFIVLAEHQGRFKASVAVMHSKGAAEIDPHPYTLKLGEAAISVDEPTRKSHESWMRVAALSLSTALLMLNIQGVEKEVIEPTKLNKKREQTGKPSIPRHTVMRIGHAYDHNGARVGLGTGRQMPVHMRAGHARHQRYGEGNELTKIIYIPPVLVNFKPGSEARQPKRILAA